MSGIVFESSNLSKRHGIEHDHVGSKVVQPSRSFKTRKPFCQKVEGLFYLVCSTNIQFQAGQKQSSAQIGSMRSFEDLVFHCPLFDLFRDASVLGQTKSLGP